MSNAIKVLAKHSFLLILSFACFACGSLLNPKNTELEHPTIIVETQAKGFSAEVVEDLVSKPLEKSISSISGVHKISSTSQSSSSTIEIEFEVGTDIHQAAQTVLRKLQKEMVNLPPSIDFPLIRLKESSLKVK